MIPADKRLGADRFLEIEAVDRLEIQYERAGLQRLLHIVQDFLLGDDGFAHRLVVIRIPFAEVPLDRGPRQIRTIAHGRDLHRTIDDRIDAVMDNEVVSKAEIVGQEPLPLQQPFQVKVVLTHAERENVGAEPSADALPENLPGCGSGKLYEDAVADLRAVNIVDDLETIDIKSAKHEFIIQVFIDQPTRRMDESVTIGNTRQAVQPLIGKLRFAAALRFQLLRVDHETDQRTLTLLFHIMLAETGERQSLPVLPLDMHIKRHRHFFLGNHADRHTETVIMLVRDGSQEIGARRNQRGIFPRGIAAEHRIGRRKVKRRERAVVLGLDNQDAAVDGLAAGENKRVKAAGGNLLFFARKIQKFLRHLQKQRHPVRLVRKAGRAETYRLLIDVVFRRRGQHDNRQLAEFRRKTQTDHQLQPVHARHQNIHENQRRVRIPLQEGQRFDAVSRLINVRKLAKRLTNQRTTRFVVVHDQNLLFLVIHVPTSSCLGRPDLGIAPLTDYLGERFDVMRRKSFSQPQSFS